MPPVEDFNPLPGEMQTVAPGVRRILAPNPSPMTFRGTNSYIVGRGQVAVIDPGPDNPDHLQALRGALAGEKVSCILITHSHLDHSPLAARLSQLTGAPVMAYGNSQAGRSVLMQRLAKTIPMGGGEGVDADFTPDRCLADTETITGPGWQIDALWTPGHFSNHMCFAFGDILFTGDHIMGWASSMVSPPDGDVGAFMASCARLSQRQDRLYLPGHGAPIREPKARLDWLIAHRKQRESEILARLAAGPAHSLDLVDTLYGDISPGLKAAARRNVLAHLIDLADRDRVSAEGQNLLQARFSIING